MNFKNLKHLLTLLITVTIFTSCSKEQCTETVAVQYLSTKTTNETLVLFEDTCIEGDLTFFAVRLNGYTLTHTNGDLNIQNWLRVEGGTLKSEGNIYIGSNLYFYDTDGLIDSDKSIFVAQHTLGTSGAVNYCNIFISPQLDEDISAIKDCTPIEVDCNTLNDNGVTVKNGDLVNVPCDYDYENQKVKIDNSGNQFIYIKTN